MPVPKGPYLEFEKPVVDLSLKIDELLQHKEITSTDVRDLLAKKDSLQRRIYSKLSAWNRVELARRTGRPYTLDYVQNIFTDFVELHGDRCFGDDAAIVAGFAKLKDRSVAVIGHQKGRDTKESIKRNFGMAHPEGYRKALRVMRLAAKFGLPVVTFIDTPGAYPGIGAEERGQAEAIAVNLREMAVLPVPIVVVVIGEGASGGALGIGVGDRLLMLENAWFSVISPEGCAAIIWGDAGRKQELSETMKLTAQDLFEMKVMDRIVPEPLGGAHWDPDRMHRNLQSVLVEELAALSPVPTAELLEKRLDKLSKVGLYAG